jgi:opacity protein-like surface antigen
MKIFITTFLLTTSLFIPALASESGWFVRPYIGISQMSDTSANATQVDNLNGDVAVSLDSGFTAGLGLGYQYNSRFAAELAWEYRSNGSQTTVADQSIFKEGNYASNLFFINGFYFFPNQSDWTPYLGAGLSLAQEIDIDLERDGIEQSYAGSGDFGYQLFAGANYHLSKRWSLQLEIRYASMTDLELEAEADSGLIDNIDYNTSTAQLGLVYHF